MGTEMLKKFLAMAALVLAPALVFAGDLSEETKSCLNCHRGITPGIVGDRETSRHSRTSPAEAMQKPELERRMSAQEVGAFNPPSWLEFTMMTMTCTFVPVHRLEGPRNSAGMFAASGDWYGSKCSA